MKETDINSTFHGPQTRIEVKREFHVDRCVEEDENEEEEEEEFKTFKNARPLSFFCGGKDNTWKISRRF